MIWFLGFWGNKELAVETQLHEISYNLHVRGGLGIAQKATV